MVRFLAAHWLHLETQDAEGNPYLGQYAMHPDEPQISEEDTYSLEGAHENKQLWSSKFISFTKKPPLGATG